MTSKGKRSNSPKGNRSNSPKKSQGELVVPKHGKGLIRRGSQPGNTPGTGRPPDAFKALCRELASRAETIEAVSGILQNPDHPAYLGALKWATENGYGKPHQTVSSENLHRHAVIVLPPLLPPIEEEE
jgi:hypothetical protein